VSALILDIADAIVDQLTAGATDGDLCRDDFTAAVLFDSAFELKDSTLHVDVLPAGLDLDIATRATLIHLARFDVLIREKIGDNDAYETPDQQIRHLLQLAEEIARYLTADDDAGTAGRRLATLPEAVSDGPAELRPPYVPRHLREWRQFTSIVTVTYRVDR
jgi:hypothetical protein